MERAKVTLSVFSFIHDHNYTVFPPYLFCVFVASVIHSQPRFKNIKWKVSDINNINFELCVILNSMMKFCAEQIILLSTVTKTVRAVLSYSSLTRYLKLTAALQ